MVGSAGGQPEGDVTAIRDHSQRRHGAGPIGVITTGAAAVLHR